MRHAKKKIEHQPIDEQYPSDLSADVREDPIPISRLIELRKKNLSYNEIAELVGRTKQTVHKRLQPYVEDINNLQSFKDHRADILAVHQARLLNSLTPDAIKECSPYQRVGMFGILYDKERIERGMSTQNIAYADYSAKLSDLEKEEMELRKLLGTQGDD